MSLLYTPWSLRGSFYLFETIFRPSTKVTRFRETFRRHERTYSPGDKEGEEVGRLD